MKLILRADVENLGSLGDVVEVKPGYGRNYLIPQGIAMIASKANLKAFELERKKLQARMDAIRSDAQSLAEKLNETVLDIIVRVGENDKLYGSVTTSHIADALAEAGIEVDRRRLLLDEAIRQIGSYPVRVRLHADVVAEVTVNVVPKDRPDMMMEEVAEEAAEENAEDAVESAE